VPSARSAKLDAPSPATGKWHVVLGLLNHRQIVMLMRSTAARIAVGVCDLALVGAIYFLFLLLQHRTPAHDSWWMPGTTLQAALLTSVLVVVRAIVDHFSSRSVFRQIQSLSTDFLLRLTQDYSEMEWGHIVSRNRSELTSRALHTTREAADFYHRCVELASSIVIVVAMTAAFVYESYLAALGFACTLAAFYAVHRLIIRGRVQQAAANREGALAGLQRILADLLLSGKEIRTYGNQAFFFDRIRLLADKFAASNRRAVLLPQAARNFADQGTILLFLGLIVADQMMLGDTSRLLSLLVFYFVLSRRLLPLVSQVSLIAGQMESCYENVRIVNASLEMCSRYRAPLLPIALPAPGFVLQVQYLSFAFDAGAPILRNLNLVLRPGETVVLHGPSGNGKTSLLNLIAGVAQPDAGIVRVNRQSIAYVPQEISLLDDSVRNNLLFGLSAKSDEDLWKALAAARLDDFVAALPRGLETQVGDNGALFSGGERQRLGLARAILRGSQLLLLDEATSAMDEENEQHVITNLAALGTAVVMVTHRRRAGLIAQRVYRLQDGDLVEEWPSLAAARRSGITELTSRSLA
jgi:ABC-type multidrug transport system fused ATPase/permease subunit